MFVMRDGQIRRPQLSDVEEVADRDRRIEQLEQQCEVLAAEVDRMRPVVDAACWLISPNFIATRADLTSLSKLVRTVREYQASKPK